MDRKKIQRGFLIVLQVILLLGIAFMAGYLLLGYCTYGEREVSGNVQMTEPEKGEKNISRAIRVRIMSDDFLSDVHSELSFTSQEGFAVANKRKEGYELVEDSSEVADLVPEGASEIVKGALQQRSEWDQKRETKLQVRSGELEASEVLVLEPVGEMPISVNSLNRADGVPQYYGKLYVWQEEDGLALLNVLPLEKYLYSVVSSEMPSNYPLEAQKAQAVCARTYAVNCMGMAEEGTLAEDVTDSVNFQVYNNYGLTDISKQAVDETAGEILELSDIQYYSTSCLSEHRTDLDSDAAFAAFLKEEPASGAEYDSRWLRWRMEVSKEELLGRIEAYALQYCPEKWVENDENGELTVTVGKRRGDGQVQELCISCGSIEFTVEGEYNIRKILGVPGAVITLMDGSCTDGMQLLPSAFFYIEQAPDGQAGVTEFILQGGGYGHGNGMSQCGAAAMAEKGMDYKAIIGYYYSVATDNL